MSLWQRLKDEFSSSTVVILPGDFMWKSPAEVAGLVLSRVLVTGDGSSVEEEPPPQPKTKRSKVHLPRDYDDEFPIYDNGIFEIVVRGVDEDLFMGLAPQHAEYYLSRLVESYMDDPFGEVDMGCFGPPLLR